MHESAIGYTAMEIFQSADELSRDPVLRSKAEAHVRSLMPGGEASNFWIDELGIGHFQSSLHSSSTTISIIDSTNSK